MGICIPIDVFLIGDVLLIGKGAGDPLPGEGIGAPIPIEQVGVHPLGGQFPMGAGQVTR